MSEYSSIGRELYALLPAVYRNRDNSMRGADGTVSEPGDLFRYLDACGLLLDRMNATLDQRLADAFPDNAPEGERSCQAWLLSYFADLLDVRLVSPEAQGQRDEIANAVAWRQGKGTLTVLEAVAEAVGQFEAEIQEGWRRVALTARVGMPLLPATALGEAEEIDPGTQPPSRMARHPGLPATTVDLRRASGAVRTDAANPVAKVTAFENGSALWRLANPHAAPCFPGSYQDNSQRTVDFRNVSWRQGHYHPRRILIYLPPPPGFFRDGQTRIQWDERDAEEHVDLIETEEVMRENGAAIERVIIYRGLGEDPLCIDGVIVLPADHTVDMHVYRFENLCLNDGIQVTGARVEISDCAVRDILVEGTNLPGAQLDAKSSLFGNVAADGLVRMEYCTVGETLMAADLQASDCIFVAGLVKTILSPASGDTTSCIRFSRVPVDNMDFDADTDAASCTRERAIFYMDVFGARGCSVLHPAGPEAICFGAEDGGEMGAFHERRYCLRWMAIHDKLADYLPVGQKEALIPDERLLCTPPNVVGQ